MKWIALCLVLSGCGPSCEEKGGVQVQNGYFYVPQTIGNITFMQPYPNYVCVTKEKHGN